MMSIILVVALLSTISITANANADTPDNEFLSGYREGVLQAKQDIANHHYLDSYSESHIPCPPHFTMTENPQFCSGYKAGYSHEAFDEIP
jgi:hypothetical protein